MLHRHLRLLVPAAFLLCFAAAVAQSTSQPIQLSVDVTDAPRKIIHAVETMPIAPGEHTLMYPKWIPGEHGPTGPIDDLTGLIFTASRLRGGATTWICTPSTSTCRRARRS
jgi:hypothetical protein